MAFQDGRQTMSEIKIHIFPIGKVCVAPELPFGGEHYSALKASGVLDRKSGSGCRFRPISSSARTGTFCSTAAGTAI